MGSIKKLKQYPVELQVYDHLPVWAYTKEEWQTEVVDKTYYVGTNGLRYIKVEPETTEDLELFVMDIFL